MFNVVDFSFFIQFCYYTQLGPQGFVGNEDCLYLNIYTPELKTKKNLPVWIFIFGGRRILGHASPYKYGPEYLMDHEIILVTFSYRLGVAGFLSTEDDTIPGNYGLKDQSMALKWVYQHISDFGGDPTNITVGGGSSGGVDASLHLFSPLSNVPVHGEELMSLFSYPASFPRIVRGDDRRISEVVLDLWVNFITAGNPNTNNDKEVWKPVSSKLLEYLHISNASISMKIQPYWDGDLFWKKFGSCILHPQKHSCLSDSCS